MNVTDHIIQQQKDTDTLVNAFTYAMNTCDLKKLSACFTADADFTNVIGRQWHGQAEIESAHYPLFAPHQIPGVPSFYGSVFEVQHSTERFIKPGVAVIDIFWEQRGTIGPDGQPWPTRNGLINAVAVKNDDEWLFIVFHNMVTG